MGVLRVREFRLLFLAQAVSLLGDRMVSIALAFAVLSLGGSPAEVGLVLAFRMVPLVGTLLVGGVVADRVSRRAVMVVADLSRVATQGLIAALLIGGLAEIWMLAVLSGLTGAATGFFNPASTGLLPAIVPAERVQEANGVRATAMSGGEIVGPSLRRRADRRRRPWLGARGRRVHVRGQRCISGAAARTGAAPARDGELLRQRPA
jgi:MFS family permease